MKNISIILLMLLTCIITVQEALCQISGETISQQVSPETLVKVLPDSVPRGYLKTDRIIDAMPGTPVYVTDYYTRHISTKNINGEEVELPSTLTVAISDQLGYTAVLASVLERGNDLSSYWKNIKVRGKYPGMESVLQSDQICLGARKAFIVNNRFLIEIEASYFCDLTLFDSIIERMNPEALP